MRVLLAYDSSPQAKQAADFALRLPLRKPANVNLVSVVEPPLLVDASISGVPLDYGPFLDTERKHVEPELQALAGELAEQALVDSVDAQIPMGSATIELLRAAEQTGSNLIVLGAVGHSGIARVLLGSVSDYVATHADVSTLVVRTSEHASTDPAPKRIMIALSGQAEDESLLTWMEQLQPQSDIEIHLVRILDRLNYYRQDLQLASSIQWGMRKQNAERQLSEFSTKLHALGWKTETHLVDADHVGEALVEYAHSHQCDLVMTGDRCNGLLTRVLLGSVSRYVLRHVHCSVLIVRGKNEPEPAIENRVEQSTALT